MTTQTRLLSVPPAMSGFCDDRGNEIPFEVKTIKRYNVYVFGQADNLNQILLHSLAGQREGNIESHIPRLGLQ